MIEIVIQKDYELEARKLMMQIYNHLEPFYNEPSPLPYDVVRVQRPLMTLENGDWYEGDWDEHGRKDGKGILFKVDGSLYEGYWKADKAHGRGRSIHASGEMYNGEWKYDKKHGYGKYIDANGSI